MSTTLDISLQGNMNSATFEHHDNFENMKGEWKLWILFQNFWFHQHCAVFHLFWVNKKDFSGNVLTLEWNFTCNKDMEEVRKRNSSVRHLRLVMGSELETREKRKLAAFKQYESHFKKENTTHSHTPVCQWSWNLLWRKLTLGQYCSFSFQYRL